MIRKCIYKDENIKIFVEKREKIECVKPVATRHRGMKRTLIKGERDR